MRPLLHNNLFLPTILIRFLFWEIPSTTEYTNLIVKEHSALPVSKMKMKPWQWSNWHVGLYILVLAYPHRPTIIFNNIIMHHAIWEGGGIVLFLISYSVFIICCVIGALFLQVILHQYSWEFSYFSEKLEMSSYT